MSKKKGTCKCPPHLQQFCKHSQHKRVEHIDVEDVIQALANDEIQSKDKSAKKALNVPTNFKTKPFKPRHFKDTCVPMRPSMHTRLRYITHCPTEANDGKARNIYMSRDFGSSSEEELVQSGQKKFKKKVRYYDLSPGDIHLTTPCPVVKHTASDDFIVDVGSPKTSGEVIRAQEAKVRPGEWKPPLPAKSGHELFKPHSGIVINQDKSYVPDVVHLPGKMKLQKTMKLRPCHKKGVCKSKSCPRKKCRKYQARKRRGGLVTLKSGGGRSRSRSLTSGATDGKPRAKGLARHVKDDDSNCGLDEIPRPEHAFIPPNLKKGMLDTHSLTVLPCTKEKSNIHYGILNGSFNMYDSKFGPKSRGRQALTMSVMAYCLAFHYHPKQWTSKLIDSLVDSGDAWYLQCLEKVHDHSAIGGICEVLPYGKKQTLVLNGKKMQVLLGEPDVIGYTMSKDPTVYNLCRGLIAFFKDHRAGILLTRVLKLVVWKDKVCYYIFDPAGRDSRAYSNYANGTAAVINVVDVKSVAEVLLSRSILDDQRYVLASLKVLRMVKENADEDFESDPELTQAEKAMLGYRIMNENCAIVNANMHLGERCFEEAKYRQAVPIAVVAMTYAKISPPNTWFSKTLDKILRLGNKLYHECIHPNVLIDLTIDNIPNVITLGPYACEIIIYRERVKGQLFTPKECIFNIRSGLMDFFSHEYNSGILEFNHYYMAVWRQKEMFYLFDPYPRTVDGSRSFKSGRACCWMLLNPESMAQVIIKNFDYMPATTQFYVHAFKVLKLKKKQPKAALVCTLSDENIPDKKKIKRTVLHAAKSRGDSREVIHDVMPAASSVSPKMDEEQMGDIVSLVDSIQDDYVPSIPLKYKHMPPEPFEERVVNLDSPTVSVTQVVPPWPAPRDKSHEPPEPDPSPEPTPPPTPPPPPIPEGGVEEEEPPVEEEEDEEAKKERLARKKAEEEEARRKAEELPPPLPPPPSPQPEPAEELHPLEIPMNEPAEVEAAPPPGVERKLLLTEDAHRRFKLRALRRKTTAPLTDDALVRTASQELKQPSNFKSLPDNTEIIRGSSSISDIDALPFASIMAVVTSYKYMINTWGKGIVDFGVTSGKELHSSKRERFQTAPVHVIPKIGIGKQAYSATIDVVGEGATWEMEDILTRKFLPKHDRGIITTSTYSCAFFVKNGLYYLYDPSPCNPMGLMDDKGKGSACLLRFRTLHDLVASPCNPMGLMDDKGKGSACLLRFRTLHDLVASPCNPMGLMDDKGKGSACLLRFRTLHDLVTSDEGGPFLQLVLLRYGLYYLYDPNPCNPMGLMDDKGKGSACLLRFRTLHDLVARAKARLACCGLEPFTTLLPGEKQITPLNVECNISDEGGPFLQLVLLRYGLYYLYDPSPCNPMGLMDDKGKGSACLLRFRTLHDLVTRINYNRDGTTEDQQFIASALLVRRLLAQPRYKLPEDYEYDKMAPKSNKSKSTLVPEAKPTKRTSITIEEPKSKTKIGYSPCDGVYKIEGTTCLKDRSGSSNMKSCHFVSLMAMLMATMHPIRTWDHTMVDTCIEKGVEIYEKATNLAPCEKRVIKNVIMDGKFMNVNIKKIIVINNNAEKKIEQYISAVSRRLRYFLIHFPQCSLVVCHSDGYYHLFDPYESPKEEPYDKSGAESKPCGPYASWTLYRSQDALVNRLRKTVAGKTVETPSFYTFELTSIKTAPRHSALNYRLSPLFKPDENPNSPYLKYRRVRPLVDEKMYWLNVETIPWSRMNPTNDLGFPRKTPRTLWKEWDIEFPGDLYSLWGSLHPLDTKFDESNRGKQYLATSVVALVMSQACHLSAWTGSFLDGIVNAGDRYHKKCAEKIGKAENHELAVTDLDGKFDDMFPYSFSAKFDNIIFGFVYNMLPDRFNLSKALDYFFESHDLGLLVSPTKNLAFGRSGRSYFMFDCQSYGAPIFCPGQGSSYMLKCESLNRLVYCMTLTLNIRRHGIQFHLFSVNIALTEKTK
ncbi:uncharacterized protein LOC125235578 [Leguminivora glycinivorella]|uniref:uncharacterized protein LOC125235578 n=1 Tax=Leguminivora glycinivorella TaxID=1035111 RepID=UPI00200F8F4A|nr:uncharacterized protein LOC125235578 [Leguminivora glycinivorella]